MNEMLAHSIHEVSLLSGTGNSSFVWYNAYREECDRNIMENIDGRRDKEKIVKSPQNSRLIFYIFSKFDF